MLDAHNYPQQMQAIIKEINIDTCKAGDVVCLISRKWIRQNENADHIEPIQNDFLTISPGGNLLYGFY